MVQGVTKRCRLSWLTNSTLVYKPKCEGSCGVSANEDSCTHSPTSIFNLWGGWSQTGDWTEGGYHWEALSIFYGKIILLSDRELVETGCTMYTDKKNVLDIFRLLTVRTNGEDVLMVIGGRWRHPCKCSGIFYQFFWSHEPQCTTPKIWNKYSQKWNCAASFPISTFLYLWAIYTYIPEIGPQT